MEFLLGCISGLLIGIFIYEACLTLGSWFTNKKKEIEKDFQQQLKDAKPKQVFCLYCDYNGIIYKGCNHPSNKRIQVVKAQTATCPELTGWDYIKTLEELNRNNDCQNYKDGR